MSARAMRAHTLDADAAAPFHATRLAREATTFRGGPIVASTGETVDVRVSDALPAETATPEGWAEFLAGLIHGTELSQLTTYVVTFDEMQDICGTQALGCYARNQLVVPVRRRSTRRLKRSRGTSMATTSRITGRTRPGTPSTGGRSGGRASRTSARA